MMSSSKRRLLPSPKPPLRKKQETGWLEWCDLQQHRPWCWRYTPGSTCRSPRSECGWGNLMVSTIVDLPTANPPWRRCASREASRFDFYPKHIFFYFCNQDFLVDAPDDINIEAGSSKYRHKNKKVADIRLYNDGTLNHTWAGQQNWLDLWSRAMLSFSRRWWLSTEGRG